MSHNGHGQNVLRQTGLDIYNDAAKILEELLEERLDKNLKVPMEIKQRRTLPNPERVEKFNSEYALVLNKKLSVRHSTSLNEHEETNDFATVVKQVHTGKTKGEHHGGSESSIDTDDEQAHFSEKRRKKSLFKMAKERLRHTFNHHQKDKFIKVSNTNNNDSLPPTGQKLKNEHGKCGVNVNVEADKSVDHKEAMRSNEIATYKAERSVKIGFSLNSFRRTKKSSTAEAGTSNQDDRKDNILNSLKDNNGSVRSRGEDKKYGLASYPQGSGTTSGIKIPSPKKEKTNSSITPPPHYHPDTSEDHTRNITTILQPSPSITHLSSDRSTSHNHQPSQSRSPSLSLKSLNHPAIITAATSTSSCNILQTDNTSNGSATKTLSSLQSNSLDSPGEDIEYMDIDNKTSNGNSTISVHTSNVLIHDSQDLLTLSNQADKLSGGINTLQHEMEQKVVLRRRHVNIETTQDVNFTGKVIVSEVPKQVELEKLPLQSQQSSSNKEAIYKKISQRLIELSDHYAVSEQKVIGASAAQPPSLSDLEKDIIACLRKEGDRYSRQLDESFEEVTQQTTQEAYQRFQSTMKNSVGSDLSWDHLAFLFYTTKGVMSAVGKGSRTANQVKEFSLQYISDTFASWIMDQGGFDSVLSSAESDFDVD